MSDLGHTFYVPRIKENGTTYVYSLLNKFTNYFKNIIMIFKSTILK